MELACITVDIQEVIGCAVALNLLLGIKIWQGCVFSFTFCFLLLFLDMRVTEGLFALLLAVMGVSFCGLFFYVGVPQPQVISGLLHPRIPAGSLYGALAIVGAVIMPHNLFLHSALVLSRQRSCSKAEERERREQPGDVYHERETSSSRVHVDEELDYGYNLLDDNHSIDSDDDRGEVSLVGHHHHHPVPTAWQLTYFTIESIGALVVSLAINICVVSCFAFAYHQHDPSAKMMPSPAISAKDLGLGNAAQVLEQLFGPHMRFIWGAGLLAAGNASTLSTTIAGQYITSGLIRFRISPKVRMLVVRLVALGPALLCAGLSQAQFDSLNQFINVLQCLVLPFALVPTLAIAGSSRIMGEDMVTRWGLSVLSWGLAGVTVVINLVLLVGDLQLRTATIAQDLGFLVLAALYFGSIAYLVVAPWKDATLRRRNNG